MNSHEIYKDRPNYEDVYWVIRPGRDQALIVASSQWYGDSIDRDRWQNTNLFRTEKAARAHLAVIGDDGIDPVRTILLSALQSARDYGSASWDDWLIERVDAALALATPNQPNTGEAA